MASIFKSGTRAIACARPAFRPNQFNKISPIAQQCTAFHTSRSLKILPVGPQVIKGDINDPAPVPPPNATHGSYHWDFERLIAVGLIPLTITPFVSGSVNPVMDAVLGSAIIIHSHIGFQACIIDYIPQWKYAKSKKVASGLLNAATALMLYGLYEFETNDVGITEAVKRVWKA